MSYFGRIYTRIIRRIFRRIIAYLLIFLLIFLTPLQTLFAEIPPTLPSQGKVMGGQADIMNVAPNQTDIHQHSNRAIINWKDFNIGAGSTVNVKQPDSSSILLNRVVGPNPSVIQGNLNANGWIFLINPAGILFTKTAMVDVGGLHATTANISDNDFLNARNPLMHFIQAPDQYTSVVNQGTIKVKDSGIVSLVAPGVEHSGYIYADLGKVFIGTGMSYTLDLYGDKLIQFDIGGAPMKKPVTPDGRVLDNGALISGLIQANGGKVIVSASDAAQAVSNVINMKGIVEANTVKIKNGEIHLLNESPKGITRVTGKLKANGKKSKESGGKITLTGDHLVLQEFALISANGLEASGGDIRLGGDYKGQGPLPNSKSLYIGKDVSVHADGEKSGNGGRIIAWSNNATQFYGELSAIGEGIASDGGFIELSSKMNLKKFSNKIYAKGGKEGKKGTILFDPADVHIAFLPDVNGQWLPFPPGAPGVPGGTETWTPNTASPSTVNANDINFTLQNDCNVIIETSPALGGNGDIIFDTIVGPISGTASLTLNAVRDITHTFPVGDLNPMINAGGTAALTVNLSAGRDMNLHGINTSPGGAFAAGLGDPPPGVVFLGSINILTANNVTNIESPIHTGAFTQQNGTGTTTFTAPLNASGNASIKTNNPVGSPVSGQVIIGGQLSLQVNSCTFTPVTKDSSVSGSTAVPNPAIHPQTYSGGAIGPNLYFFNGVDLFVPPSPPPQPPSPPPSPSTVQPQQIIPLNTCFGVNCGTNLNAPPPPPQPPAAPPAPAQNAAAPAPAAQPAPAPAPAPQPAPAQAPAPAPAPELPPALEPIPESPPTIPLAEEVGSPCGGGGLGAGGIGGSDECSSGEKPLSPDEKPTYNVEEHAGIAGVQQSPFKTCQEGGSSGDGPSCIGGHDSADDLVTRPVGDQGIGCDNAPAGETGIGCGGAVAVGPNGFDGVNAELGAAGITTGIEPPPPSDTAINLNLPPMSEELAKEIATLPGYGLCPEGPDCIPGVDSLGCPEGPNCGG